MSNAAQTWAIIGGVTAVVGIVVGLQTFWVARSLDKLQDALTELGAKLGAEIGDTRTEVREVKDVLLREHGQRIARLEERITQR
jgi:hypothetical protein